MTKKALHPMAAPADRALVYICEQCGKRAGGSKHAGYQLASNIKQAAKRAWGKGQVRVVLTSCMDTCPEEGISVAVLPLNGRGEAVLVQADVHDVDGASEALLSLMRAATGT